MKINEYELARNLSEKGSWHEQYKDSPYIFVGGLPFELNEGDVKTIFSQYGAIKDVNLARDKLTGKSKGFCFVGYEDQRSTILAVDNFNLIKVLGRELRVDHVLDYKKPMSDEERQALKDRMGEAMATEIFLASMGQKEDTPSSIIDEERELRRLRKQERRARETSEERRLRKSKNV